jgi:hypothetical protein
MSQGQPARAYQLVLEFAGESAEDFDRVIGFEDLLCETLASDEVDGHDVGQGIMNIFIFTNDPRRCFQEAMRVLDGADPGPIAAGFRAMKQDRFVRLWPANDSTPFTLR